MYKEATRFYTVFIAITLRKALTQLYSRRGKININRLHLSQCVGITDNCQKVGPANVRLHYHSNV